jgi:hypothetical protein
MISLGKLHFGVKNLNFVVTCQLVQLLVLIELLLINRNILYRYVHSFIEIIYFILLKNAELLYIVMLSNRATVALFTIAITSSLLLPNSLVGSAFAAKKKVYREDDFSIGSLKSSSVNAADLSEDKEEDDSDSQEKNSKSKCDQAPTLAEQRECYRLACNDYD